MMNAMSPISVSTPALKVMHVVQCLDIGGLEKVVIELARRLDRNRFSPEILCLGGCDIDYTDALYQDGIAIHVMKKKHRYDLFYFIRVANFIRRRKICIIHAHSGCFFYAALFALLGRVRTFIFTAHGLPVLNRWQDIIEDNIAGVLCDTVVAVSDEIKAVLSRRMPFAKKKIRVIYNGVDTELFRPFPGKNDARQMAKRYNLPDDVFIIGSVGRLEPVKNYAMFLQAAANLHMNGSQAIHVVLVGEGSERAKLEQLAADLGITGNVTFLGKQYAIHEVVPLFKVFVLSSLTEGTSISLLEAQSSGVPAVVTDVGGNSHIIRQGINGFLCAVNDDIAMVKAISRLQESQALISQMAERSRRGILQKWGFDRMKEHYEAIYIVDTVNRRSRNDASFNMVQP